jgi:hypothetical protein
VARSQLLRPFPDYINVNAFANHGSSSIYHSLKKTVERRYSNGLSALVSYTFSKLINDSFSIGGGGHATTGLGDYRIGRLNRRLDRAPRSAWHAPDVLKPLAPLPPGGGQGGR